MRAKARGLSQQLITRLTDQYSDEQFTVLVFDLVARRANTRPPAQALKLLLALDTLLYQVQGQKAVE